MSYLLWLPEVLRKAGLTVVEVDGWQTRGKPWLAPPRGFIYHHTAGPKKGNAPSLGTVTNGRGPITIGGRTYPAVPGPLSQFVNGRDGTWYIVAAGRANHAGVGSYKGITAGSSTFLGSEAENQGIPSDPWPAVQVDSIKRGAAALMKHMGAPIDMCIGHKEWAPRRKIDPHSTDMDQFRRDVAALMGVSSPVGPGPDLPALEPLRLGSRGNYVRDLQRRLGITADGIFGPATEAAVKAFQAAHGLTADGIVGAKTWAALG